MPNATPLWPSDKTQADGRRARQLPAGRPLGLALRGLLLFLALPALAGPSAPKAVMAENFALLQQMAAGEQPFEASRATAARSALAASVVEMVVAQQSGTLPLSAISEEEFSTQAEQLLTLAEALEGDSLPGLRAGLPRLEAACSACHALRQPQ